MAVPNHPPSLLFLQKSTANEMGIRVGLDLIIFEAGDGPVDFQYGERRLVDAANPVFPERAMEFIHADMLPSHV
jgi:hypothetical protein